MDNTGLGLLLMLLLAFVVFLAVPAVFVIIGWAYKFWKSLLTE